MNVTTKNHQGTGCVRCGTGGGRAALPKFPSDALHAALAWPRAAGGLIPWTIYLDTTESGHIVTFEPPCAEGLGFVISPDENGVMITWRGGLRSTTAPDLVSALQLLCPLSPANLAKVQADAGRVKRSPPMSKPPGLPAHWVAV